MSLHTTTPKRIRMSRQHPWRADNPDAVIVARPSRWGNPFRVGQPYMWLTVGEEGALDWPISTYREPGVYDPGIRVETCRDRATAVKWFRAYLHSLLHTAKYPLDISALAGRDLACWCPLPEPGQPDVCHGAVLLEIANGAESADILLELTPADAENAMSLDEIRAENGPNSVRTRAVTRSELAPNSRTFGGAER